MILFQQHRRKMFGGAQMTLCTCHETWTERGAISGASFAHVCSVQPASKAARFTLAHGCGIFRKPFWVYYFYLLWAS